MAGKSNFIVRGGADFSGIKREMQKTQATMANFQARMSKTMSTVGKILGTLAVGKLIKDSTAVAMSVESSMDNINRNMGNSAKAFQNWVNTQSKALGMAKADAYKYGSTFSNLLRSFQKDSTETANSTQELMKAAAIISSKTGRTYDDTANRIRSGMLGTTEAIEDLGVYANISMIQSTEAFKKFAGNKSWAQLDFQTQQQIRLAAIMEQTYARYGDTLADTTTTIQNQFVASLKNAQLSLGQAFLPVYNVILPALTRMADALGAVINKIAQFSQALFGKANVGASQNTEEQTTAVEGLGDAAEKTGKQAKKAKSSLAGFDELNVLSKADGTNEGTESGNAGMTGITMGGEIGSDVTVSPDVENAVNNIKEQLTRIKEYANTYLSKPFNEAINMIRPKIEEFKNILGSIWANIGTLGQPLKDWFIGDFTPFLQTTIQSIGTILSGLFDSFNMVFSDIWNIVVYPFTENFLTSGLPTITDFATKVVEALTVLFEEVKNIFDMLWCEGVKPALDILIGIWTDAIDSISKAWNTYGEPIFEGIKDLFLGVGEVIKTVWETTLKPVWDTFMQTVDWLWTKHLKPLLDNFLALVGEFITGALLMINEFVLPLVNAFVEMFGPNIVRAFQTVIDIVGTLFGTFADVISGVITIIRGIIEFLTGVFTGDWKKAWNGIVNIFKGIFEGIGGIIKGVVNVVIDLINGMMRAITNGLNFVINGMNKINFKMPDWLGGGSFGLNIPTLTAPQIPKLATGAVIPPNAEFLAILGDQKSGTNIETPERLLRQIMREELGGTGQQQIPNIEIPVYLDNDSIGRAVIKFINEQYNRSGELPFPIGTY